MTFKTINSVEDILNWRDVSESIEKADSDHCSKLEQVAEMQSVDYESDYELKEEEE